MIYFASWPWTIIGGILILIGYVLYIFVKNEKTFELKRNLWLMVYIVGIVVISYIGSKTYIYDNILPIAPLGILNSPYDLITLGIFAAIIFVWAYFENIKYKPLADQVE